MVRPRRRRPPRESVDRYKLAYDFSPSHGWGSYASRGDKGDSLLVWEDRPHLGQNNSIVQLLPTAQGKRV